MASRANQIKFAGLALFALAGTAGTFVFGILAGEGGKYHRLIILLGVLCASAPVVATAIGGPADRQPDPGDRGRRGGTPAGRGRPAEHLLRRGQRDHALRQLRRLRGPAGRGPHHVHRRQPDLEIMKTLANLLAVGLALAARIDQPALKVPAQGKREVTRSTELLPAPVAH
jgi:hypothetical protein